MEEHRNPDIAASLAAAIGWWRDAGVDLAFHDEPQPWIKETSEKEAPKAAAPVRNEAKPTAQEPLLQPLPAPPDTMSEFIDWWITEAALDDGRTAGRVPPRGMAATPEMMVIVGQPEREDEATLLSARQGQLLDAMFLAMGIDAQQVWLASALPRYMPMADWAALNARGLGRIVAHHVALVRPKRLIVFGGNILPLFGNDPTISPAGLRIFNHEGLSIPLLAARDLAALLERPRWKAGFWQDWLEWSGSVSTGI